MPSRFRPLGNSPGPPRALVMLALAVLVSTAGCRPPGAEGSNGPRAGDPEPSSVGQERGAGGAQDAAARPPLDRAWVIFGADTVVAEVARTDAERSRGLMFRNQLPDGTGMLFVFPDQRERSFWMRDTYVPLDIAFMDANFTVIDIQSMEPESTEAHRSARPASYALEVPQGWFEARGIEVGAVAEVVY